MDEGQTRRRDLYLTAQNTHKRQTPMPLAGFEQAITESERLQAHAIDSAASGIRKTLITITQRYFTSLFPCPILPNFL